MGHGVAGWLTPGWMIRDKRFDPHIEKQPDYVETMLRAGEDPKSLVLEECKPMCKQLRDRVDRCETQLEKIVKIDPTKTCMYPMRDWVTCVEACTQPAIHNKLEGTH